MPDRFFRCLPPPASKCHVNKGVPYLHAPHSGGGKFALVHRTTSQPSTKTKAASVAAWSASFLLHFRIKKLPRWRATRFLFFFYFFAPIKKNRRAPATQVRPRGGAAAAAAVFCCTFAACSKQVVLDRLCACSRDGDKKKKKKRCYTVSVHIAHGCHASHQVNNHVSYHLIHRFSFHAETFLQRLHYVLLMQLLHDIRRQRGSRLKC